MNPEWKKDVILNETVQALNNLAAGCARSFVGVQDGDIHDWTKEFARNGNDI
jgi:hypothetical protein